MRSPPPLASLPKYPITGGVSVLAVAVSLLWWQGKDVAFLFEDYHLGQGQLWRLVTSALPHVNFVHLAFNLCWLWVFGTLVEHVFGPLRAAAVLLFFAAGSGAAEYALFDGGVGLSGVGYGFFGLLWVLSRKDPRFADAVDQRTVILFVAWFFVGIALTVSQVLPIGNVAHGAGAVLGVLLGWAITAAKRRRRAATVLVVGVAVLLVLAATVGRPYVNRSSSAWEQLGYHDLQDGKYESAVSRFRRALDLDPRQARCWTNLGIAYQRLNRFPEAADAYQHALDLGPGSAAVRSALADIKAYLASRSETQGTAVESRREERPASTDPWFKEYDRIEVELQPFYDRISAKRGRGSRLNEEEDVLDELEYFHQAALVNNGAVFDYASFMIEHKAAFEAIGARGCLAALDKLMPFYQEQQKLGTDEAKQEYWHRTMSARVSAEALAEDPNEFGRLLVQYAKKNASKIGSAPATKSIVP